MHTQTSKSTLLKYEMDKINFTLLTKNCLFFHCELKVRLITLEDYYNLFKEKGISILNNPIKITTYTWVGVFQKDAAR